MAETPTRGRFITLEGGDGAGKTVQARRLAERLRAAGHRVLLTREPGGAPGADVLRTLLLDPAHAWTPLAETLLHFAARAEHVVAIIRPALDDGITVVCDRFSDSTMAYQGFGQGANRHAIATLSALIGIEPDLTLVLDVSPGVARERLRARDRTNGGVADRYERLGEAFHARVTAGFRAIAAGSADRCVLIPADGPPESIEAAIHDAVRSRLR